MASNNKQATLPTKESNVTTGFLDSLKPVALSRAPARSGTDTRQLLLDGIAKQVQAVQADLEGKPLPFQPSKFKVNGKERTREFSRWYTQRDGSYFSTIRYGQVPLVKTKGDGGKDVPAYFPAGKNLKDVLAFFEKLVGAVKAGELDAQIKSARARKTA